MLLANMAISISIPNDPKILEMDFETILNDLLKSQTFFFTSLDYCVHICLNVRESKLLMLCCKKIFSFHPELCRLIKGVTEAIYCVLIDFSVVSPDSSLIACTRWKNFFYV